MAPFGITASETLVSAAAVYKTRVLTLIYVLFVHWSEKPELKDSAAPRKNEVGRVAVPRPSGDVYLSRGPAKVLVVDTLSMAAKKNPPSPPPVSGCARTMSKGSNKAETNSRLDDTWQDWCGIQG